MEGRRFYFKKQDDSAWWNLKSPKCPEEGAVEITKAEWDAHIAELEAMQNNG